MRYRAENYLPMAEATQRVVLVDTAPRGSMGSMARYGRMVESAVRDGRPDAAVARVCLALPERVLSGLPIRLATACHHAWLWYASRRPVWRGATLYHVLDGSHAYVGRHVPVERLAVTCHDIIPYLQLQGKLPGRPGKLSTRLIHASLAVVRRAAAVTAVSGNTRDDLTRYGDVDGRRITVVHAVLDPVFAGGLPEAMVPAGQRPRTILHMGNNAAYKNRVGVVDVFERLAVADDTRLVLAGPCPSADLCRRLEAAAKVRSRISLVTDPSDEALQQLYGHCRLLLFPSLYEGFGSPVLEAMASGCPVVCSTSASLPEVTGGAALMAGATDVDALTAQCRRVLDENDLADALSARGLARARQFTATGMGAAFRDVYARLGLRNGQPAGPGTGEGARRAGVD